MGKWGWEKRTLMEQAISASACFFFNSAAVSAGVASVFASARFTYKSPAFLLPLPTDISVPISQRRDIIAFSVNSG